MATIGVILVSVREGRKGAAFAHWIHDLLAAREGVRAELIDLKDWLLPAYTYPVHATGAEQSYAPGSLQARWAERIRGLDGFIVVTPEYNRGYPGHLKTALDSLYQAWNRKPVAFVGYGGFSAGSRVIEQLKSVCIELQMVPLRDDVNLGMIGLATDERGYPSAELFQKKAKALLDSLLYWTRLLKRERESGS